MQKNKLKEGKSGLGRPLLLECQGIATIGGRETVVDWELELKKTDVLINKCQERVAKNGVSEDVNKYLADLQIRREHVLKKINTQAPC